MRGMGVEDEELFLLEAEVRRLVAEGQQQRKQQQEAEDAAAEAAAGTVRLGEQEHVGAGKGEGASPGAIAIDAVACAGMPAAHSEAFQRWLQPSPPSES